jgi:recombination protein RecR
MFDHLPDELKNLIQSLSHLPSVGQRTGVRYAMNILQWSKERRMEFIQRLQALDDLKNCLQCGIFLDSEKNSCPICDDSVRQNYGSLCIVENFQDYLAIERGHHFKGLYHLLGGVLNPMLGIGPEQLKLENIVSRVQTQNIHYVLLALNSSMEGDATSAYLAEVLSPYCEVERIGFGVPIGSHLEYLDSLTIGSALENRKKISKPSSSQIQ